MNLLNLLELFLLIFLFGCFTFVVLLGIINTIWKNGGKLSGKIKEWWKSEK